MKGHTQQTQQRGLLFTIHHEFQVETNFSHLFRLQMHVSGGTNVPRTHVSPDTCHTRTPVIPGHLSTRTKMPGHVLPGHIFPGQMGLHLQQHPVGNVVFCERKDADAAELL